VRTEHVHVDDCADGGVPGVSPLAAQGDAQRPVTNMYIITVQSIDATDKASTH